MSDPECVCLTLEAASVKNPMNSPINTLMKKTTNAAVVLAFAIFLLIPTLSPGQDQGRIKLAYEQVYGKEQLRLSPFPRISGWADDSHSLVMEREEKSGSYHIDSFTHVSIPRKKDIYGLGGEHFRNPRDSRNPFMNKSKRFEHMVYPRQTHGFGLAKGIHSNRHCIDFWFKHFLDR